MKHCQTWKRAFTLQEALAALALLAVATGLIATFAVALKGTLEQNARTAERVAVQTSVRTAADYWFSVFDNANYALTVTDGGEVLAYAQNIDGTELYAVRFTPSDGTSAAQLFFALPQNASEAGGVTVECGGVSGVRFAVEGEAQGDFSFAVTTHVNAGIYRCELTFGEGGTE